MLLSKSYIGQIVLFAGQTAPPGWIVCQGGTHPIAEYQALFDVIGNRYGGDGVSTFAVPELPPLNQVEFYINASTLATEPEPLLGEIILFATDNLPAGFAPCRGQAIPIEGNQALYSLIETWFGGDGYTTFGLPKLVAPDKNACYAIALEGTFVDYHLSQISGTSGAVSHFANALIINNNNTWVNPQGQSVSTADFPKLYSVIGNSFGGDGSTFTIPTLPILQDKILTVMAAEQQ